MQNFAKRVTRLGSHGRLAPQTMNSPEYARRETPLSDAGRRSFDSARTHPSGIRREKGQILVRKQSEQAYHVGCNVWVPETSPEPGNLSRQKVVRWVKGQVCGSDLDSTGNIILAVRTEEGAERIFKPTDLPLQNERDDTVDDLVKSDFLHEPGSVSCLSLPDFRKSLEVTCLCIIWLSPYVRTHTAPLHLGKSNGFFKVSVICEDTAHCMVALSYHNALSSCLLTYEQDVTC